MRKFKEGDIVIALRDTWGVIKGSKHIVRKAREGTASLLFWIEPSNIRPDIKGDFPFGICQSVKDFRLHSPIKYEKEV